MHPDPVHMETSLRLIKLSARGTADNFINQPARCWSALTCPECANERSANMDSERKETLLPADSFPGTGILLPLDIDGVLNIIDIEQAKPQDRALSRESTTAGGRRIRASSCAHSPRR